MDPCFESAARLARAIRKGRLSAQDATDSHLERIARLNGPINALVVVDGEGARKAARAADRALRKKGASPGPLHGVPITIKEAFDVAGLRTSPSATPAWSPGGARRAPSSWARPTCPSSAWTFRPTARSSA